MNSIGGLVHDSNSITAWNKKVGSYFRLNKLEV